jgi:predicted MFS family arabinose efflux permease
VVYFILISKFGKIEEKGFLSFHMRLQRNILLFILAFGVSCIGGLFGVAFSNYLLFERSYSAQEISILNAIFSAGYTFIPLLLVSLIKNISKHKLIISTISCITLLYSLMLFVNSFFVFFVIRIADGALNGLFWSNLEASLSSPTNAKSNQQTISKYNLSWNLGLIFSALIGIVLISRL